MNSEKTNRRLMRLKEKIGTQVAAEYEAETRRCSAEEGHPDIDYFLDVLCHAVHPDEMRKTTEQQMVMALCVQAPLELFHAAGLRVYKLACGSFASQQLATGQLPAIACPMVKSLMGMLQSREDADINRYPAVIPTTCDWVVKFSELTDMNDTNAHFMELPRIREGEKASTRWLEEIYGLKTWLEKISGRKITRKDLRRSMEAFMDGYALFSRLVAMRRKNKVPSTHFAAIANALPYADIRQWNAHVEQYMDATKKKPSDRVPVFLAGSPVLFPNYKLLHLIEEAGMSVVADDTCSMERVFPGATCYEEPSEFAMMRALAERHHKACICPTFADNQRRIHAMLNVLKTENINGVIFHVLKGCHPYDIEAILLENALKERGIRFLKIETDYVKEDEQNIVTRLEAFRQGLSTCSNVSAKM